MLPGLRLACRVLLPGVCASLSLVAATAALPLLLRLGWLQVVSHVVIGLKTVKGTKQLKLDPTIYDSLQASLRGCLSCQCVAVPVWVGARVCECACLRVWKCVQST